MSVSDFAQLGVLAVTAVAIFISLRGLRDQLWLQTFSEYTRRYAEALDPLPAAARLHDGHWDLHEISAADHQALLAAARRYLNLCSEEFYLQSRHRIDKETWLVWTAGMRSTMKLPALRDAWELLGVEYEYYRPFHSFMTEIANNPSEGRRGATS